MMSNDDIRRFEHVISQCNTKLKTMVPSIALSKTVIDMASDRRKKLLAECMLSFTKEGKKGATAENAARATKEYATGFKEQETQLRTAYEVDFEWRRISIKLDSARSMLAVARETMHNFKE